MKEWLKTWGPTIISIIATIIVGYLGIIWSQNQFRKAELERKDRIKDDIVQIIEEHVINNKIIGATRLSRLIDAKCRSESVSEKFTSLELLKSAEYNLIESRHIDFMKKEEYKNLFDSIYNQFTPFYLEELRGDSSIIFNNPELVRQLNMHIQNCETSEAINSLSILLSDYEAEITRLQNIKSEKSESKIEAFLNKPLGIVITTILFIIYLFIMFPMMKRIYRHYSEIRVLKEKKRNITKDIKDIIADKE